MERDSNFMKKTYNKTKHYNTKQFKQKTWEIRLSVLLLIVIIIIVCIGGYFHFNKNVPHQTTTVQKQAKINIPKQFFKKQSQSSGVFEQTTFPKSIQGSYVKSIPLKQQSIGRYYKVDSIIRITRNNIYEQLLLLPKIADKLNVKTVSSSTKQRKIWSKYQDKLKNKIPSNVRTMVNKKKLFTKISNFNYDGQPGNLTQDNNNFSYGIKLQTMISSENNIKEYNTLKSVLPNLTLLPIKPYFYNKLHIYVYQNNPDLKFDNVRFHQISARKVANLSNQSYVHPYYLGIGSEKVIDKK